MEHIHREAIVPFSASQMYELVADIESYPQYFSSCRQARLIEANNEEVIAELVLGRAGIEQRFSTRNRNLPGRSIEMTLEQGPFTSLEGIWEFEAIGESGCKVSFDLTFEMQRQLLQRVISGMIADAANRLVDSVVERAVQLYG